MKIKKDNKWPASFNDNNWLADFKNSDMFQSWTIHRAAHGNLKLEFAPLTSSSMQVALASHSKPPQSFSFSSTQVIPSPEYPSLHSHVKLPSVFVQRAFSSHASHVLFALTQSAKTLSGLLMLWTAGIRKGMPAILLSFNREAERSRFERTSVNQLEKRIKICAKWAGVRFEIIPLLKFTGNDMKNGDEEFEVDNRTFFTGRFPLESEQDVKRREKKEKNKKKATEYEVPPIPVYVALSNVCCSQIFHLVHF